MAGMRIDETRAGVPLRPLTMIERAMGQPRARRFAVTLRPITAEDTAASRTGCRVRSRSDASRRRTRSVASAHVVCTTSPQLRRDAPPAPAGRDDDVLDHAADAETDDRHHHRDERVDRVVDRLAASRE
jgi:hypothetical protein